MVSVLETVFRDTIHACHPEHWVASALSGSLDTGSHPVRHLFACGKAAAAMARAALRTLPDVTDGIVIVPEGLSADTFPLTVLNAGHPYPDHTSVHAGETLGARLASLDPLEPFVFLLSGGASALMEIPREPLTIGDLAATARLLMAHGFPIDRLNRVRTALSMIKGGGLGRLTRSAGTILVMSDVPGDSLADIGSGPFIATQPCHRELVAMLEQADIWSHLPTRVRTFLQAETPQTTSPVCSTAHHIGMDNDRFITELKHQVEKHGIRARIMEEKLAGEARQMGTTVANHARRRLASPGDSREVLIWGGETTVTVTGRGRGGRNQEAALGALLSLSDKPPIQCLFAGTDGVDGSSDATGAVLTPGTWDQVSKHRLNPSRALDDNDSHGFFRQVGGQIRTGWTGLNVMDVAMVLIQRSSA